MTTEQATNNGDFLWEESAQEAIAANATCVQCIVLSVENLNLKAECARLQDQLRMLQAGIHCRCGTQYGEVDDASNMETAVTHRIKIEPVDEVAVDPFEQIDTNDIKEDPLEMEQQEEETGSILGNIGSTTAAEAATITDVVTVTEPYRNSKPVQKPQKRRGNAEQHFVCMRCFDVFGTRSKLKAHACVAHTKSSFICAECGKEFATKHHLKQHRYVHGDPNFKCSECPYASRFPHILASHMRTVHGTAPGVTLYKPIVPESFRFQCYVCKLEFREMRSVVVHLRSAHPLEKCTICDEELALDDSTHLCIPNRSQLDCEHCATSYGSTRALVAHLNDEHTDQAKLAYSCTICQRQCHTRMLLEAHKRHAHAENPNIKRAHRCEECGKEFATKHHLKSHRYVHGDPNFKCSECPYASRFPYMLGSHMRTVHGMAPDQVRSVVAHLRNAHPLQKRTILPKHRPNETIRPRDHESFRFQCYICKIELATLATLRMHLQRRHAMHKCEICDKERLPGDTSHDCLDKRSLPCEYCRRPFDSLRGLMAHLTNDHDDTEKRIYVCDICRRTFRMRLLLEAHAEKHTRGSFACTKCPQVFDKKLELNAHLRRDHFEANHLCDECGKGFATKASLRAHKYSHTTPLVKCAKCPYKATPRKVAAHTRRLHAERKSCTCHVCGKLFDAMHKLTKHAKIHTRTSADQKYACVQCPYKTYTHDKLQYHIRGTHAAWPAFQCTHCDKSYKHKGDLTKHLREHLGENIYKCFECPAEFRTPWELRRHSYEHSGVQAAGDSMETKDVEE